MSNITTEGQAFREAFLAEYHSDRAVDAQTLEMACQLLDEVEQMSSQVARDGYMITGSQDQPVVNPLIRELRAHRKAFVDIAKTLAPDAPRLAGQALARKRWDKNGPRYRPRPEVQQRPDVFVPDSLEGVT